MGTAIAYVMGKKQIDKKIYQIMEDVAFSTAYGWHADITKVLITKPRGMTVEELSLELQISVSSVQRRLNDLRDLKIVYAKKLKSESRGRPTNVWIVSPTMKRHWKTAKVNIK